MFSVNIGCCVYIDVEKKNNLNDFNSLLQCDKVKRLRGSEYVLYPSQWSVHISTHIAGSFPHPISWWFTGIAVALLSKWKCMRLWWVIIQLALYWSFCASATQGMAEQGSQSQDGACCSNALKIDGHCLRHVLPHFWGTELLLCCQASCQACSS